MKVAHTRGPGFSKNICGQDYYDPRTPIIRERRRFTDVMDEEIDDERKERINQYGSAEVYRWVQKRLTLLQPSSFYIGREREMISIQLPNSFRNNKIKILFII